jgi:predicted  nucleic acid-binding Zn-ribbon protein
MEVETIKKSQRETTLKIENLEKKSGVIDASITNRIQEIEERISSAEDTIENIDSKIKTTLRFHLTSLRITKIKKLRLQQIVVRRWRKRILLHCWWNCKLVQQLWKPVW